MAGRLGLVNAGGLMAARNALKSMLAARAAAERQAMLDALQVRKQDEIERAARAGEGFEDRRVGVSEGTLGQRQYEFDAEAPTREAGVGLTRAQTGSLNQKTQFEGEDRAQTKELIDLLPAEVEGQVSPRTLAGLKAFGGVDMMTPSGRQSLYSAKDLGTQAGTMAGAEFDAGGRRVAQGKQDIETAGAKQLLGLRQAFEGSNKSLTPNQELLAINRLQKQWEGGNANYSELKRQEQNMRVGLDAARRGDMAAGSQAVLVTFQKILDPTSVVRESEYARSAAGQSLMNRIQGFAERLAYGGAGVPIDQLEAFANVASEMLKHSDAGRAGRRARLERTAKSYNLDPALIFDDTATGGGAAPSGTSQATPPTQQPAMGGVSFKVGGYDVRRKGGD